MSCEEAVKPKKNRTQKTDEYQEKSKEFKVRPRQGTALYEVYFEEGGQIPKILTGAYTSQMEAKRQVKLYESNRRQYY